MFNGSGKAIDKGPPVLAEDFLDIMGKISILFKPFLFVGSYHFITFCQLSLWLGFCRFLSACNEKYMQHFIVSYRSTN